MPRSNTPKKIQIPIYLDPGVYAELKALSTTTRVPQQAYLREAVEWLLNKYHRRARPNQQS